MAGELILSFVPDPEQRLWRTMTRTKHQLGRDRVRLQNQIEAFLEDARIKLSSYLSDLLGVSGKRILQALAEGEQDATRLAKVGHARPACHPGTVTRGGRTATGRSTRYGVHSAQQVIAEVGPRAATFPSAKQMSSWVGTCPGREESAGISKTDQSPKGNRAMRRILNQVANAAVKSKGAVFEAVYRRLKPRLGHGKALWAVANRFCKLTWKILHQGGCLSGVRSAPESTRSPETNQQAHSPTSPAWISGSTQPHCPSMTRG
jgi:transposase